MNIVAPPITVGSDAVVTVSLTPSDATGNVSVGDKTVKVDGGVAEVVISNLVLVIILCLLFILVMIILILLKVV